eukprot:8337392-Alexandrium_andersonii.AAC.1
MPAGAGASAVANQLPPGRVPAGVEPESRRNCSFNTCWRPNNVSHANEPILPRLVKVLEGHTGAIPSTE